VKSGQTLRHLHHPPEQFSLVHDCTIFERTDFAKYHLFHPQLSPCRTVLNIIAFADGAKKSKYEQELGGMLTIG
jgi:hypothetical protein